MAAAMLSGVSVVGCTGVQRQAPGLQGVPDSSLLRAWVPNLPAGKWTSLLQYVLTFADCLNKSSEQDIQSFPLPFAYCLITPWSRTCSLSWTYARCAWTQCSSGSSERMISKGPLPRACQMATRQCPPQALVSAAKLKVFFASVCWTSTNQFR